MVLVKKWAYWGLQLVKFFFLIFSGTTYGCFTGSAAWGEKAVSSYFSQIFFKTLATSKNSWKTFF